MLPWHARRVIWGRQGAGNRSNARDTMQALRTPAMTGLCQNQRVSMARSSAAVTRYV